MLKFLFRLRLCFFIFLHLFASVYLHFFCCFTHVFTVNKLMVYCSGMPYMHNRKMRRVDEKEKKAEFLLNFFFFLVSCWCIEHCLVRMSEHAVNISRLNIYVHNTHYITLWLWQWTSTTAKNTSSIHSHSQHKRQSEAKWVK